MSEKRIDPEDGQAYTWEEFFAYYKKQYNKKVCEDYFYGLKIKKEPKAKGKGKGKSELEPKVRGKAKPTPAKEEGGDDKKDDTAMTPPETLQVVRASETDEVDKRFNAFNFIHQESKYTLNGTFSGKAQWTNGMDPIKFVPAGHTKCEPYGKEGPTTLPARWVVCNMHGEEMIYADCDLPAPPETGWKDSQPPHAPLPLRMQGGFTDADISAAKGVDAEALSKAFADQAKEMYRQKIAAESSRDPSKCKHPPKCFGKGYPDGGRCPFCKKHIVGGL